MSDIDSKHSDVSAMPTYAFCPVISALEVIGERWVILILRDLLRNPSRRFQDLQDSLKGCAPSTLSTRLKSLEANGLIERRLYEQHPPRLEYLLTTKGREVGPVVASLRDWGCASRSRMRRSKLRGHASSSSSHRTSMKQPSTLTVQRDGMVCDVHGFPRPQRQKIEV